MKIIFGLNTRNIFMMVLGFVISSVCLVGYTSLRSQPSLVTGAPLSTSQPVQLGHSSLSARKVAGFVNKPSSFQPPLVGFGESVAIHGDTLVVGASNWGMVSNGKVFVYQYRAGEWVEQTRLVASDRDDTIQHDHNFGKSVAIYGDTIAVGAPKADDQQVGENTGAVYIFERRGENWEQTNILKAPDIRPNAGFGRDAKLSDDTLVVTLDYGENGVYIFKRSGDSWIEQARLSEGGSGERDWFGASTAVHGDWLAVSVQFDFEEERGWRKEAVYLYRRDGDDWQKASELSVPERKIFFGSSLAMDGETLVIGAPGDREAGFWAGAAFVYRRDGETWREQAKLIAPDSTIMTGFGSSAAVQGDILVISAPGSSEYGFWSGQAYLYQYQADTWIIQEKLIPPDESKFGGEFGSRIAIDGDTIGIAAPDEFGNAVYIFEVDR